LVCPGHQWSFDLRTGWESVKEQCQPTYTVRITGAGRVEVDLASRTVVVVPDAQTGDPTSHP
jgi:nitrite reductase (NADH) small subunit